MEVGVDIVKVDRFEKLLENDSFKNKYFNKQEIEYISNKNNAQTMAGIYASKEALLKALGMGIGAGLNLKDIIVLHNANGKPYFDINATLNYYLNKNGASSVSLSISHDGEYVVAFCTIF